MKRKSENLSDGWVIFRLDLIVTEGAADNYMIMDLKSRLLLASRLTMKEGLSQKEISGLLSDAKKSFGEWPKVLFMAKADPIEKCLGKELEKRGVDFRLVTPKELEPLIRDVKESFSDHFFAPAAGIKKYLRDDVPEDDRISAEAAMPDAYHDCPCASGKKYKFCCKPIWREITGAMMETERGRIDEAFKFLEEAKRRAGEETAEILCRAAIVHSFRNRKKSFEYLKRALELNPKHPRANYILGIEYREAGDLEGAMIAYQTAIENYPKTDRFHLNEAMNNLGIVFYDLGEFEKAKETWERALVIFPSDSIVRKNLREFIYENPDVPKPLRKISPFVEKFFNRG